MSEIMKIINERETQKKQKNKKKTEKSNGYKSYSERVRAKWFCCVFKLGFLQLICKVSLIFKLNLELALEWFCEKVYMDIIFQKCSRIFFGYYNKK